MENLDLKQMSQMVKLIAEEKGLPEDTVLDVIEQAIAAAWRKENGDREMNVRATLNTQTGEADVYVTREVIEDGVGYNPATEVPLDEAKGQTKVGRAEKPEGEEVAEAEEMAAEGAAEGEAAEEGNITEDNAETTESEASQEEALDTTIEADEDGENNENDENKEDNSEPIDDGEIHIGDLVEEKVPVKEFGRVAAMTAKQVVIQRLREAENDAVLAAFEDKIGTVVTGTVSRVEPKLVRIDLGRASGIMPRSEQIDGEYYTVGSRIKVYVKNIERGDRGTQLILSRGNAEFIEYLFRQEVPELASGAVEIKGIAREAGRRTKIAVMSTSPGVDPVGTFVGGRGIRVQAVMNEIGDREKIDIINWSDNPSEYIREALSPAEISKVEIDGDKAKVYVTEDQQKIAIGTKGQNVRLASKLTGYDIDIELVKAKARKKKKNIEDSLLSAIEESEIAEAEELADQDDAFEAGAEKVVDAGEAAHAGVVEAEELAGDDSPEVEAEASEVLPEPEEAEASKEVQDTADEDTDSTEGAESEEAENTESGSAEDDKSDGAEA